MLISFVLQWQYNFILLEVIWAIGGSMVLLAALVWLPRGALAVLALAIIARHDALPVIQPVTTGTAGWALLHNPPFVSPLGTLPPLLVAYSVGPWLGVRLAGYVLGPWFALAHRQIRGFAPPTGRPPVAGIGPTSERKTPRGKRLPKRPNPGPYGCRLPSPGSSFVAWSTLLPHSTGKIG